MTSNKTRPFPPSRSNSPKIQSSLLDKSLSNFLEEPSLLIPNRQSVFLPRVNSLLVPQASYQPCYNVFKTDANHMPSLLEKYTCSNLYYKDEEFSQQAQGFIANMATDEKIPKYFKAKFPLYQILITINKIFMLNEYEMTSFACSLDCCDWKIPEVVYPQEAQYLKEFPTNFAVEIDDDCRRFIIYLLILVFSIKQNLNEKNDIDPIQAYCEKICDSFQVLYNRWVKNQSITRFNYSAVDMNKKTKFLSKKEHNDLIAAPTDYNMMVDKILSLTGCYNSKSKGDPLVQQQLELIPSEPQDEISGVKSPLQEGAKIFFDTVSRSKSSFKTNISEDFLSTTFTKRITRQFTQESIEESSLETQVTPDRPKIYERQMSLSQLLTNFSSLKREAKFQLKDEGITKKNKKYAIEYDEETIFLEQTEEDGEIQRN